MTPPFVSTTSTADAPPTPGPSGTWAGRLRWAVTDAWTVTRRDLVRWSNQPGTFVAGLAFSVMVLLMMGALFGGAMAVPGDYWEFLVPGVLALTMVFGVETTFTAVNTDLTRGVTDRFRSLPMAASAVVVGRASADLLHSVLTLAVLATTGLALGWRPSGGLLATLAGFGLLLLLRSAMLWLGIYLGLVARNPESVMALQVLVWPIGFLSNVFVSPATMPSWLGVLAEWNPLSATVSAVRELFDDPGWASDSWIAAHSSVAAVGWPVVLIAVFLPLSVRRYRRLGHR